MSQTTTFADLGLSPKSLDAISRKGFTEPTAIQAMTIPALLRDDTNIIARAQTGTGKTAAFGLPLIEMIDPLVKHVQALILVPTRELAIQVAEEIDSLKGDKNITAVPIYGGQSIEPQLRQLKRGVNIVVGSPGRVLDHIERKSLRLGKIEHLVLDEADEMLNMGFIEDMEEIFKHTNPAKRTLLFSATMPRKIKELARQYMDGYEFISVEREQPTTELTEQEYFEVKASDKFEALCRVVDIEEGFYGLVFCRTKIDVDTLATRLLERGYNAEALHGDISQSQRERTLDIFKKRRINILVATDVAARGIDVMDLTHVINFSLPHDPESYVHRIGRTGRAGKAGKAISFITPNEYRKLQFIQRIARADIKKSPVPTVKDIIKAKRRKIYQDLNALMEKGDGLDPKYQAWAEKLLSENPPVEILAALLNYSFAATLDPGNYGQIKETGGKKSSPFEQAGKTRLFVALGKKDQVNARKIVALILDKVAIKAKQISDIEVMDKFSFITVPDYKAEKIVSRFHEKGRAPLITHVKESRPNGLGKGAPRPSFARPMRRSAAR
ncbi:MAG: DEAD/DEAH box helicase [Candidatus Latescibacteria bacterium]|nr:DEAD/DEAH box helicase [Candidatus Latescibacterota bacterium]